MQHIEKSSDQPKGICLVKRIILALAAALGLVIASPALLPQTSTLELAASPGQSQSAPATQEFCQDAVCVTVPVLETIWSPPPRKSFAANYVNDSFKMFAIEQDRKTSYKVNLKKFKNTCKVMMGTAKVVKQKLAEKAAYTATCISLDPNTPKLVLTTTFLNLGETSYQVVGSSYGLPVEKFILQFNAVVESLRLMYDPSYVTGGAKTKKQAPHLRMLRRS